VPGRERAEFEETPVRNRALIVAVAATLLLIPALTGSALGASEHRRVTVLDACDPTTFDAALQNPDACVRPGGGTTFDRFIGQLQTMGEAAAWRFAPSASSQAAGGSIDAYNLGGEFHTFTEVAAYGGGCVAVLNQILGLSPVAECANAGTLFATTGIAPGAELEGVPLAAGTHLFQCLIHPWMRSTVVVH
jgi:plastocyanin